MTIKDLGIRESAVVTKIGGEGALRQHFLDMGLIPGTKLTVIKYAPMGDPVEVMLHGYELTLRLEDAAKIDVAPVREPAAGKQGREEKPREKKSLSKTAPQAGDALHEKAKILKKEHPGLGEGGKFHTPGSGNPLPDGEVLTFALVGNQNCGKTTLFNRLGTSRASPWTGRTARSRAIRTP